MAENTRLKELQAEINKLKDLPSQVQNHGEQIKRMMDLLELRDQEQQAHTAQVQADANARWEQLQQSIQALANSSSQPHGSTSTSPPPNQGTKRTGI